MINFRKTVYVILSLQIKGIKRKEGEIQHLGESAFTQKGA